jgi:hypothetical protein
MNATWVAAAVLLLAVIAVPFAVAAARGERVNLFSPPVVMAVAAFVGYLVPIPSYRAGLDVFSRDWPMALADRDGSMRTALLCAAGGLAAWQVGFYLVARLHLRRPAPVRSPALVLKPHGLALVVLGYAAAAIALFGMGVFLLGGVGVLLSSLGDRLRAFTGLNYFIQAPNLMVAASLLWWITLLLRGRRGSLWFWCYLVITVLFTALLGNKSNLLVMSIAGGVLYDQLHTRIRRRMVLAGGVVMFMGLMFYAMYFREYRRVGYFTTLSEGVTPTALLKRMDLELGGNFMQLQNLTIIVDRVPSEFPYQNGKTFLALLAAAVPRKLWAAKPLPATGIYTLAFWPDRWLVLGTTMPPGIMAEFYLNFSWMGVLAGMLLAGVLMGRAYRAAQRPDASVAALGLNALLIAFIPHYMRGEMMGATVWLLMMYLPLRFGVPLVVRRPAAAAAWPPPEAGREGAPLLAPAPAGA